MKILIPYIALLLWGLGYGQQLNYSLNTISDLSYADIKKGFKNPPNEAKMRSYWWWLNGMATKTSITRDLSEMKAKGYGGAIIFDAGSSNYKVALKTPHGPDFSSPEWHSLFAHAIKISDSLDMELSLNIQSGWNPGGPTVTPEQALKKIVASKTTVQGPGLQTIPLPNPSGQGYYRDIIVQAYPLDDLSEATILDWDKKSMNANLGWKGILPIYKLKEKASLGKQGLDPAKIIDITDFFKNDTLNWNVPNGKWTVVRYGMANTGARVSTGSDGWKGLSYDHLNKKPFKDYFDQVVKPLIETSKKAGNSLKFLHTDSWEMGAVNWTDTFMNDFKRLRGYDITPYLPVLTNQIVGNAQISDRFLYDFRRTIGDLVYENNYKYFSELAHQNGLFVHPESGGPHSAPVDALQVMGTNDIPMGEFWARNDNHRIEDSERLSVKQGASAAHIYGKRFMAAEGPTSIGPQWERSPNDLKGVIDRIFCSGVNRLVWHTFTSSPEEFGVPGNEYFAGTHLNTSTTWWEQAGAFTSYLNRSSYLLSLGHFQADALYYYGDDVPNFVFLKTEVPDLGFGYDWDKANSDVLLNRAKVENNHLVLPDGMQYRVLVLPDEASIRLDVLEKIEEFVKEGLTVLGPRPKRAKGLMDYPVADKKVAEIVNRLWGPEIAPQGENKSGKGKVVYGKTAAEVLKAMRVSPDFSFKSANDDTQLDYIHRKTKETDIYFVVNTMLRKDLNSFKYHYDSSLPNRYELVDCEFRVENGIPEIWDPMDGSITKPLLYRHKNGKTIVSLYFKPEESKFIIFRNTTKPQVGYAIYKDGVSLFPVSKETEVGDYPAQRFFKEDGLQILEVFEPGSYTITRANRKKENIVVKSFQTFSNINNAWRVTFHSIKKESFTYKMDTLVSWTEVPDPRIKYYSGKATYNTIFRLPKKQIQDNLNITLDLGNLQDVATVRINGKEVNTLWKAPYRIPVKNYLNAGSNTIEIEIINLWPNRLIGDSKLPPNERTTKTNINKFDQPDAEKYLRKSGLFGLVRLRFSKKIKL
ncbi:glycoside hydrolase family 2 [Zobellia amurskyensis]|uniref:Glycoside hydrolase family 2 n=1 Tax=Zobellia amurskyensis TaxID=248905 RepID=A0A7X3D2Z1_9FLAO|nr:glycosyl hydrolase [Zobellia amurskyensis]MUH36981.1 glycoside hydrolase family 2 [Zobellia amurskyensis]